MAHAQRHSIHERCAHTGPGQCLRRVQHLAQLQRGVGTSAYEVDVFGRVRNLQRLRCRTS